MSYDKPLIGLNTWEVKPYCDGVEHEARIIYADSPQEAVKIAIEKAKNILGIQ